MPRQEPPPTPANAKYFVVWCYDRMGRSDVVCNDMVALLFTPTWVHCPPLSLSGIVKLHILSSD